MPHVVIDFSAGLEDTADMKQMCIDIRDALAADASIPAPQNIRVRARAHDYFATPMTISPQGLTTKALPMQIFTC